MLQGRVASESSVGWQVGLLGPGDKIGGVVSVHYLISTFDLPGVLLSDTLR